MNVNFFKVACQTYSNKKKFGICDDPAPSKDPAYIDENDGGKWIAVVENEELYKVTFTAVDNCVDIKKPDGNMDSRCDGFLSYNSTIIFVELKERFAKGNDWVEDGEKQLRTTIRYFEATEAGENFKDKKAYIANKLHPKFKVSQSLRMEKFLEETRYVLRIVNRIILE